MRTWAVVRMRLDAVSDVYLTLVGARHLMLVSMLALRVVLALVLWATPTYAWSAGRTVVPAADLHAKLDVGLNQGNSFAKCGSTREPVIVR